MRKFFAVGICGLTIAFLTALSGCQSDKRDSASTGSTAATVATETPPTKVSSGPLQRGTFALSVKETLGGEPTDPNITNELFSIGLVQHGFSEVENPKEARYVIQGDSACKYFKAAVFNFFGQETHLEHQYEGTFSGTVTDTKTGVVEKIEVPRTVHGRNEDELARIDIRRDVATLAFDHLINGSTLGNAKVKSLIDAFADEKESRTFNQIAAELVAIGAPSIPYLLGALRDERDVMTKGTYPGVDEDDLGDLRYCHVIDLALSDIFLAYSGLTIETGDDDFVRIMTGWTWAWEDRQGIPESYRIKKEQRKTKVAANVTSASSEE